MGRFPYAVHRGRAALTEIDLVEIGLEDRVLVVAGLDQQGHHGLARLAAIGALGSEEEVLDQLLGQRAAALRDAAGAQVREQRASDAAQVDPGMRLEALVLDRQHRVDQVSRHLGEPHQLALLPHRTVVGAQRLGLEQHGADGAARRQLADVADERAAQPQRDIARLLGPARMLERPDVDPDAAALPDELPGGSSLPDGASR